MILNTPYDLEKTLAQRYKQLRLLTGWKQTSLSARAGVSLGSLKRFEQTGKVSLENLLKLCQAVGRLDEFEHLLKPPKARSMRELTTLENRPKAKRGRK